MTNKLFHIGVLGYFTAFSISFIFFVERHHQIIGVIAGLLWFLFVGIMAPLSIEAKQ